MSSLWTDRSLDDDDLRTLTIPQDRRARYARPTTNPGRKGFCCALGLRVGESVARGAAAEKFAECCPTPICTLDPDGDIYAFVQLRRKLVLRVAYVTGQMAMVEGNFERGEADSSTALLAVIATAAGAWRGMAEHDTGLA